MVISDDLSLGHFTAFYIYVVMLAGPMRMLGIALGMAQRAVASGNRLFEILDREPRIQSEPGAPALPAGGGRIEMRGVTLKYDGGVPTAAGGTAAAGPDRRRPRDRGRQDDRPGRPLGRGEDQPGRARRPPLRPERGRGLDRRRRRALGRPGRAPLGDRLRRRRQLPLHRQRRREHRLRPARRDPRAGRRGGPPGPGRLLHPRPAGRLRDDGSASAA